MSRHSDLPIRGAQSKRNKSSEVKVPVHAEEAVIHTQLRERGRVRISKNHEKDNVVVMAQAVSRDVVVERVSVDRFVDEPTGIRREGETLVIPVFEEVPVVVMKTKLKEEVRVTTRTTTQSRRTPVAIRRETVTIDRIPAGRNENYVSPKERESK
jgi:stress response protein YsnF